jgi:hypothetical protein
MKTDKKLFIVDIARPWRPIREIVCPIVEGKKFVWAEGDKRRYLLGASAFFMEASAKRRREADIRRIVENSYLRNMQPWKWGAAYKTWQEIKNA